MTGSTDTHLLTVANLASRLHRTPRTIQRWARERRIPHVKIGRATLFTETQVEEIVAAYTRAPVEPSIEHGIVNPAFRPRSAVVVPMRRDPGT